MKIEKLKTLISIEDFLLGTQKVAFTVLGSKKECYHFVHKTLIKFSYMTLSKKYKGIVIRYLLKMTEYSRQQLTQFIKQYTEAGRINWTPCRSNGFSKKYPDPIELTPPPLTREVENFYIKVIESDDSISAVEHSPDDHIAPDKELWLYAVIGRFNNMDQDDQKHFRMDYIGEKSLSSMAGLLSKMWFESFSAFIN